MLATTGYVVASSSAGVAARGKNLAGERGGEAGADEPDEHDAISRRSDNWMELPRRTWYHLSPM